MHLHKGILQTHHGDDQDVHGQGKGNDEYVEAHDTSVLGQAMLDQVALHNADKVKVERGVNDQVDDLFGAVPPLVDAYVLVADLQAGWHPDAVDRDVDGGDEKSNAKLEPKDELAIGDENGTTIDDDLEQELHLQSP